jgi:hypothetical protein
VRALFGRSASERNVELRSSVVHNSDETWRSSHMPRNYANPGHKQQMTPTRPNLINPAEILEQRIELLREQIRNHKEAAEEGRLLMDKLLRVQENFGRV